MNHNDQAAKMEEEMPHQNGVSATEKPSSESKNKIIPLSPRRTRLWDELLSKIVPWEKITVSLDNFPYYIDEHTKAHLMECVASHLKHSKLRKYRSHLKSSSERILLQSIPGTNLYQERLVSALAREFQVPLLKLDDLAYEGGKDDLAYKRDAKAKTEVCRLKKGNRVKYVGKAILIEEANNRLPLSVHDIFFMQTSLPLLS